MLSFFLAAFVHLAILSGGMGIGHRGSGDAARAPRPHAHHAMSATEPPNLTLVFSSYSLIEPKGGTLQRQTPTYMHSRVEIARAWDLFHLGSLSEAEAALSAIYR